MTDSEQASFDAWQSGAAAVRSAIVPIAESLPGFAGLHWNHSEAGELVVSIADPSAMPEVAELLEQTGVDPSRYSVRVVDHSFEVLADGAVRAWDTVYAGSYVPVSIAADVVTNSIRVDYVSGDENNALDLAHELEQALGLPVTLAPSVVDEPAACTSRSNCASPMRPGILIRMGPGGLRCTMGFHVEAGTDERFLTSGHCNSSTYFYHDGLNLNHCGGGGSTDCIGARIATLFATNGYDVQVVQIDDAQDSSTVYGWATTVDNWDWPITGDPVSASLGISNVVDPGTVSDNFLTYTTGGVTGLRGGATTGIAISGGDSGSPIMLNISGLRNRAIGIVSTTTGRFTRVGDTLNLWGYQIRN